MHPVTAYTLNGGAWLVPFAIYLLTIAPHLLIPLVGVWGIGGAFVLIAYTKDRIDHRADRKRIKRETEKEREKLKNEWRKS